MNGDQCFHVTEHYVLFVLIQKEPKNSQRAKPNGACAACIRVYESSRREVCMDSGMSKICFRSHAGHPRIWLEAKAPARN